MISIFRCVGDLLSQNSHPETPNYPRQKPAAGILEKLVDSTSFSSTFHHCGRPSAEFPIPLNRKSLVRLGYVEESKCQIEEREVQYQYVSFKSRTQSQMSKENLYE